PSQLHSFAGSFTAAGSTLGVPIRGPDLPEVLPILGLPGPAKAASTFPASVDQPAVAAGPGFVPRSPVGTTALAAFVRPASRSRWARLEVLVVSGFELPAPGAAQ